MVLCALTAVSASAQVTVNASAQTPVVPSFVAADPAVGSIIIGTDGAQTGFYAYSLSGAAQGMVAIGVTRSADIREGLLAVAAPNAGLLFFDASSLSVYTLPDGGSSTISYSTASLVALGAQGSDTLVFANAGGNSLASFVLGGEARPTVTLPGVPRGLAWADGFLYATVPGALVAVDLSGTVTTLASSDLGGAEGVALVSAGDALFALVASSSDSLIYVHRVTGTPRFIGTFSVTMDSTTVSPSGLAASNSTLVVQDSVNNNYKIVAVSDVVAALQLGGTSPDGGTTTPDAGGSTTGEGPGGGVYGPGGGSAEPSTNTCGVTAPLLWLPAAFALLLVRRRGRGR